MYSAERTFFCKLTAIIQHIVAQTSRLRLPTVKIQFQRTPVPHIIPPAKSANARRKRMAARSGQRGSIVRNGRFWAVRTWASHLYWLNSKIGDTPLNAINNGACRRLVQEMHDADFTPKTMLNYLQVVKSVVRSLVTNDGDPVFPREWNHEFIDLPLIKNQHQPTVSSDEIREIIDEANGWFRILFSLLPGSGMRVGEALALEVSDIRPESVSVTKNLDQ